MVGVLLALLLSGGSSPADAGVVPSELPELFIAACLNGEAKLSSRSAAPTAFDSLPRELRERLSKPNSGQIWRLNTAGSAFLYVFNYDSGPDMNPRVCGLASDEMDYGAAADAVEKRVTGEILPRTTRSVSWTDPQGGYIAIATTAGKFNVVQVNMLSDAQRAAAIKHYNMIKP